VHCAARLFGAQPEDAINTAVAIELLHNALLIHDDIEDGSEKRRGRPTLHLIHGVPLALNAGDTLTLMSFRPLLDNRVRIGERLTLRIIEETERMAESVRRVRPWNSDGADTTRPRSATLTTWRWF